MDELLKSIKELSIRTYDHVKNIRFLDINFFLVFIIYLLAFIGCIVISCMF